jgi:hypothetical protein
MDANALDHIMAAALYLARDEPEPAAPRVAAAGEAVDATDCCPPSAPQAEEKDPTPASFAEHDPQRLHALHAAATVADPQPRDVWEDVRSMDYIRTRQMPADASAAEKRRLQRYAQTYTWQSGRLYRRLADNTTRLVPPPGARAGLVLKMHGQLGHLGEKRTAALLMTTYWWRNLYGDAAAAVKACENCSRAKAAFIHRPTELNPLPIKGMLYRWGVDFAGDLPPTPRGHRYALVCIEHWSKAVVIVPVTDKEATTAAYAFLHNVLARFGAPAEVLTDQGGEWRKEFHQLLVEATSHHRNTSANHPAANGLTERAVQTLKLALRKAALDEEISTEWDIHSAWIALGYNCSPQASTRMAPYQILYGRLPTIPSAVQEAMTEPLNWEDPDPLTVVADVLQRGAAMKRACPAIDEGLLIAQHRDTEAYARRRDPPP